MRNTSDFIERGSSLHKERFEYHHSVYSGLTKPIQICCKQHGLFRTTPKSHLYTRSGGCPDCLAKILKNALQLSEADFLKRAKEIHGDRYEYQIVEYDGRHTKVTIVCPDHGRFCMRASRHLEGRGCRRCAFDRFQQVRRLSFWDFVEAVVSTHGAHRYDYQLSNHVNHSSKIKIHCPIHGQFEQPIRVHMQGHGCAACCQSAGEKKVRQALEILEVPFYEQHRFADCKSKRSLPFDFYVPDHSLLIEFDGRQHYSNSELWGGEEKLAETNRHDAIKTSFAQENGLSLLRIPYWDIESTEDLVLNALASTSHHARKISK